jgi:drug/metabolite transporter (DMT)-like permease
VGSLLAFISALAYAVMYFLVKSGVRKGDPDGGAFLTTLVNAVLLAIVIAVVAVVHRPPEIHPVGVAWFAVGGLLGSFGGRILLFAGLRRIGPVRAASLTNTAPLVTIGAAVLLLGEELSPGAVMAVVLVVIGLGILTVEAFQAPDPTRAAQPTAPVGAAADGSELAVSAPSTELGSVIAVPDTAFRRLVRSMGTPAVIGLLFAIFSAVSFGSARVLRKVGLEVMPDPVVGAFVGILVAVASMIVLNAGRGRMSSVIFASFRERRWKLWLAGVCSTIGLTTFYTAITLAPLAHVAVIAASETIITLILSAIILRKSERLGPRVIVPAMFVFAAGVLVALA